MGELVSLNLANNKITSFDEIKKLSKLTNLCSIDLMENPVMTSHEKEILDFVFASFPNLQSINVMGLGGNKEEGEEGEGGDMDEFDEGMGDMDEEGEEEDEENDVEEEEEAPDTDAKQNAPTKKKENGLSKYR